MAAPLEVIVSSDSGSQLWNSTVFDLHSGSSLLSYRGGNSSARALSVLGGQYLLSAQLGKNFINVWEIQRKVRAGPEPGTAQPGTTHSQSFRRSVCVGDVWYVDFSACFGFLSLSSRTDTGGPHPAERQRTCKNKRNIYHIHFHEEHRYIGITQTDVCCFIIRPRW